MPYKYVIGVFLVVTAVYAAIHALIYKKDPRAAFGWIAVCIFIPLFGPLLYFVFGINRVRKRALQLSISATEKNVCKEDGFTNKSITKQIPASLKSLEKVSNQITHLPLIDGNQVDELFTGKQTYEEMLQAINAAEKYIYLCVYIFKKDTIGKKFVDALVAAKNRGVKVYVLIDGIGEFYSFRKVRRSLLKQGVQVIRFLPPKLIPFNLSINLRNHRKLLVIDGVVSFVGGMNISQEYCQSDDAGDSSLKDIHFKVIGPVVKQLQSVFEADWQFMKGKIEPNTNFTSSTVDHSMICRTIVDGPGENLDHLSIILLSAINAAKKSMIIMTPYFLPSRELIAAFQTAVFRGVDVTIILPERNNLFYVHWATRHMLWELLKHGVNIFYQSGAFSHSKLFVIDNSYSLIGSANIDPRSLRLNYEVSLEVYDSDFSAKLNNYALNILQACKRITLEEVDNRPILIKIRDGIAWLFSPYL